MEHLPVEVVGNVLSSLGAARDVVKASATCSKWREAYCKHLHTLSFDTSLLPVYHHLPSISHLEIKITRTIFQTTGLEELYFLLDAVEFSASTVTCWLMYTRENLRRLSYNVRTTPSVNMLEIFGGHKLESLVMAHNSISGVYKRFPCLKSLSLSYVSISVSDLNLLLIACRKIETLELVGLEMATSDEELTLELISPTLKSLYVEEISLEKIILEADSIEHLNLKLCSLLVFEIVGKETLKLFKTDDVTLFQIDTVATAENLENVDIRRFSLRWPEIYEMISRSSKLRRLRLWDMSVFKEDGIVDLETIAVSFPLLTHLSLCYDLRVGEVHHGLRGSSQLVNVTVLELGWTRIDDFSSCWVEGMLRRCPNLNKLVIRGVIPMVKTPRECQMLASFTSSIVELMRKYIHLKAQFYFK
ncbi:hypothetical protein I3842_13G134800 [Carya illinoinensis]|uniref:F-box domain-containing protein n=1 Tax=Carya illinoinensis TaxID=32201 RepID=A0A922AKD9_CARIL|nr:hypothetical protein I3842_13G134800 [Carya illinoinensis]